MSERVIWMQVKLINRYLNDGKEDTRIPPVMMDAVMTDLGPIIKSIMMVLNSRDYSQLMQQSMLVYTTVYCL